jgi:hypothetical protein
MKKRVLTCWIYFNGTEVRGNAVMHKSYEPHWKKPTPAKTYELFDSKYDYEHETTEFDLDFGDESKKPICIDCYNDLEFDGFNLYHCLGCSGWFSQSEIITYS